MRARGGSALPPHICAGNYTMPRFEELILPSKGDLCIGYGPEKPSRTRMYDDLDAFLDDMEDLDKGSSQVWYSYATYRGDRAKGTSAYLRSFVVDIDLTKPGGKKAGYPTHKAALKALQAMCARTGIPKPTFVVDSGNGLHVYWALDEDLDAARWKVTAERLKDTIRRADPKLAVDTSRWADAAGYLRWPGTTNKKDPSRPKAVRPLMDTGCVYSVIEFDRALPKSSGLGARPANAIKNPRDVVLGGDEAYDLSDGDEVYRRCRALRLYHKEHQDTAEYPLWRTVVQMTAYMDDGREHAHAYSEGHPKYDPRYVDKIFDDCVRSAAQGQAPIRCETFVEQMGEDRATLCKGCPLQCKASASPVNVVHATPARKAPQPKRKAHAVGQSFGEFEDAVFRAVGESSVYGTAEVAVPDSFPGGLFVNDVGELCVRYSPAEDIPDDQKDAGPSSDDDFQLDLAIAGTPFWPVRRYNLGDGAINVFAYLARKSDGRTFVRVVNLPAHKCKYIADFEKLPPVAHFLLRRSTPKGVHYLNRYLDACDAVFASSADAPDRMGWKDPLEAKGAFTVGGLSLDGGAILGVEPQGDATSAGILRNMSHKGSIDGWCAMLRIFEDHGSDTAKWLCATAFAAPLFPMTGEVATIVHLGSKASGVGKTSMQRVINSAWMRPVASITTAMDTDKATENIMGALGTLPVTMDEITDRTDTSVSKLAMRVASGMGNNARGDAATGALRDNNVMWSTIVVTSANWSFFDQITTNSTHNGGSVDGKLRRVFELSFGTHDYTLPKTATVGGRPATEVVNELLQENHGLAGLYFIDYVQRNHADVKRRVQRKLQELNAEGSDLSARFWNATIAAVTVAAEIMRELRFWDVRGKDIMHIGKTHRRFMEDRVSRMSQREASAFEDYLTTHTTVTVDLSGKSFHNPNKDPAVYVDPDVVPGHRRYYVLARPFEAWARQGRLSVAIAADLARERGRMFEPTGGSPWVVSLPATKSLPNGVRAQCYVYDRPDPVGSAPIGPSEDA